MNSEGFVKAYLIRDAFDALMDKLEALCMPCREMSICKTKLEEAAFFAKKAMAINLANQECSEQVEETCADASTPPASIPVESGSQAV